jgi:ABC-type sugar transport system ATPase subunit
MYTVELRNVSKSFKRTVIAKNLNLQIRDNAFSVIFGAPASGKSTLLRLITGLEKPDKGDVLLHGAVMTDVDPGDRNIGYVPQSFALYPHYSVFENIAYPLKLMGVSKGEYTPVVEQTAAKLQISHLLQKRPDQCSGGEKQRVAIARGIVKDTDIFILDDPLTGLDFKLRERLFDDLRVMREELQATFIYTTSDPLEALMLAEDIHVFDGGQIIEAGDIDEVYAQPKHVRTMQLLGFPNTNAFAATISANGGTPKVHSAVCDFPVEATVAQSSKNVTVTLRPQDIEINPSAPNGKITFPAEVTLVEDLGGELHIYLEAGGVEMEALIPHHLSSNLSEGTATVGVSPSKFQVYDSRDHTRIGQGAS